MWECDECELVVGLVRPAGVDNYSGREGGGEGVNEAVAARDVLDRTTYTGTLFGTCGAWLIDRLISSAHLRPGLACVSDIQWGNGIKHHDFLN